MSSIVQILQVELMALIEYAKAVHMKLDEPHEKLLRSAITSLALSETNSDAEYVNLQSKGKKSKYRIPTKEEREAERERINANSENDAVWNPIIEKISLAMVGDNDALNSVYKSYGSPKAMMKWDMHIAKQNTRNYGASDTIQNGIAYFVPIGPVLYSTYKKDARGNPVYYKDMIDAGRMTLDQAITDVCGKQNIVCHFNVNAIKDNNGTVYIDGGSLGLDLLAGTPQHSGMLASMDERFKNITYESKVAKPRRRLGDTEYRIRLTRPEAVAFTEMILDPTSILRTKYIQLTAERNIKETGDTVDSMGDPDEPNSQQNQLDNQMTQGHEELAHGQEDVYGPAMTKWITSLNGIRTQIRKYLEYPDPYKPKIDFSEKSALDAHSDPLTFAMQQVQYISRFAIAFGKSFNVDIESTKCLVEQVMYDIVKYSRPLYMELSGSINSNTKVNSHAALIQMIKQLNTNLYHILGSVDKKIVSFYANAKFDTEENEDDVAHHQQVDEVRQIWSGVTHRKFAGKDGHTYTVNSLIDMLSMQIERDNGSTRSLPPKVASLYNDLVAFDNRIRLDNDLPTPEDIEQTVEYIVEPLIKIYSVEKTKPSASAVADTPTKERDTEEAPTADEAEPSDSTSEDDDDETMKMFMAMI